MRTIKLLFFLLLLVAVGANVYLPEIASLILGNLGHVFTVNEIFTTSDELNENDHKANIAIKLYNAALDLDPEKEDLILWSAMTSMTIQDWNQAETSYSYYLARGGTSQEVYKRMRGLLIFDSWCTTEQGPIFHIASQVGGRELSYKLIGDVCSTLGQKEQAIIAYRESLDYSSNDIVTISLAYILFSLTNDVKADQPEKAQNYWVEVVNLLAKFIDKEYPDSQVYYTLAWSNWQLNKFDDALAAYQKCIDAKNNTSYHSVCALHLGYAYSDWLPAAKQDLDQSLEYFKIAEGLRSNLVQPSEIQNGLGRVLSRMGQYDQALPHFQNAVHLDPNCLACRHQLAEAYLHAGFYKQAIKQYEAILQKTPEDQRAYLAVIRLREK